MSKNIPPNENGSHPPAGDGLPDGPPAPSRPVGAPKRVPGQDIDKKNAEHESKDGDVEEDGRGRLTREK